MNRREFLQLLAAILPAWLLVALGLDAVGEAEAEEVETIVFEVGASDVQPLYYARFTGRYKLDGHIYKCEILVPSNASTLDDRQTFEIPTHYLGNELESVYFHGIHQYHSHPATPSGELTIDLFGNS